MTEQIRLWTDRKQYSPDEQRRILEYVSSRIDAHEVNCPYSRESGKARLCKIRGERCWWNGDFPECDRFCEWFLSKESSFEELSPVG